MTERPAGPPELPAVAADDALLDALASPAAAAGDPAGELLAGLRGALDEEYAAHLRRRPQPTVPVLAGSPARRRRTARRLVALGGAAVLVTSAGGAAAAYTAGPGSPFWGWHRALVGTEHDDVAAAARTRADALLRQAEAAVVGAERAGWVGEQRREQITLLLDDADAAVSLGYDGPDRAEPAGRLDALRRRLAALPGTAERHAEPGDDHGSAGHGADDGPGDDRSGRSGGSGPGSGGNGSDDGGSSGGSGSSGGHGSDDGGSSGGSGSDDGGSSGGSGSDDGGSSGTSGSSGGSGSDEETGGSDGGSGSDGSGSSGGSGSDDSGSSGGSGSDGSGSSGGSGSDGSGSSGGSGEGQEG